MIFKPIPRISGLIGLVVAISCTIDGVVGVLLVPISTNMKLGGLYLKSRKVVRYALTLVGNHVHRSGLTPCFLESALP
jgi:hypothetical protein